VCSTALDPVDSVTSDAETQTLEDFDSLVELVKTIGDLGDLEGMADSFVSDSIASACGDSTAALTGGSEVLLQGGVKLLAAAADASGADAGDGGAQTKCIVWVYEPRPKCDAAGAQASAQACYDADAFGGGDSGPDGGQKYSNCKWENGKCRGTWQSLVDFLWPYWCPPKGGADGGVDAGKDGGDGGAIAPRKPVYASCLAVPRGTPFADLVAWYTAQGCDVRDITNIGHGRGCQNYFDRVQVCIDSGITGIYDHGCSTFANMAQAIAYAQAIAAKYGGTVKTTIQGHQCTACGNPLWGCSSVTITIVPGSATPTVDYGPCTYGGYCLPDPNGKVEYAFCRDGSKIDAGPISSAPMACKTCATCPAPTDAGADGGDAGTRPQYCWVSTSYDNCVQQHGIDGGPL
jgi:hypothetical protein